MDDVLLVSLDLAALLMSLVLLLDRLVSVKFRQARVIHKDQ